MNGPDLIRVIGIILGGVVTALSGIILWYYWRDVRPVVNRERTRYATQMCTFGIMVGIIAIIVGVEQASASVGYTVGEFARVGVMGFGAYALTPLMKKARFHHHHAPEEWL